MCNSKPHSVIIIFFLVDVLIPFAPVACSGGATPTQELPLGREAPWTPRKAITKIQKMPFTVDDLV